MVIELLSPLKRSC